MSYDLYLFRESEVFPSDPRAIGPILGAYLEESPEIYQSSDSRFQLIEETLAQLAEVGPEVGVDLGFVGEDVVCVSIAYWDDMVPHLPKVIQILNAFRVELGNEWFFYDPQLETTAAQVSLQGLLKTFERIALTPEPQSWHARIGRSMGWPKYRTARQKWIDAAIFTAVGVGLIYTFFW